jgi:hypothetical protein
MIPIWMKTERLPLLLLVAILFVGLLLVLIDFWQIRKDGLLGDCPA